MPNKPENLRQLEAKITAAKQKAADIALGNTDKRIVFSTQENERNGHITLTYAPKARMKPLDLGIKKMKQERTKLLRAA